MMTSDPIRDLGKEVKSEPEGCVPQRGVGGRFLTGNKGGGRPKGARNRLTSAFLDLVFNDFAQNGHDVLAALRVSDPAAYVKIIASIIPRELIMNNEQNDGIDFADLSVEEISSLLEAQVRRKKVADALRTIDHIDWITSEAAIEPASLKFLK